VSRSRRLVVVEEGTLTNGWGAEVISRVVSQAFGSLSLGPQRVAALDLPIANTQTLEDAILPSKKDIRETILGSLG